MFHNLLKTIFNETVNENSSSSSNTKNESKSDHESDNESDNESDKESNNKQVEYYYEMKQLNNWFETSDQTKSLENRIF